MPTVDLDAYFRRIRWCGATTPDFDTLAGLLRAHDAAIPFENLDVLLGRPVRLDLDSIQAKLVTANRGGYCFEHASLFAAVLEALGFHPTRHAARVILFEPASQAPRSHMFLTVTLDDATFVIDPGFGLYASPFPVPLTPPDKTRSHWMDQDENGWTLHAPRNGEMIPGWVSTLEREHPIDFEVANHYIATHPLSPFTNTILLSAPIPEGRVNIMNRRATILRGAQTTGFQITDRAEFRSVLQEYFHFDLPEVEHMKVPAIPEWD